VHKSKGLEYDHVIIMHTEKPKLSADIPLLYAESHPYPLIQPTFIEETQNIDYLKQLNKKRDQFESMRLLYVAATRAKNTLHLIAQPSQNKHTWIKALEKNTAARHTFSIEKKTEFDSTAANHDVTFLYSNHLPNLDLNLQPQPVSFNIQQHEIGTSLHFYLEHIDSPHLILKFKNHLLQQGYSAHESQKIKAYTNTIHQQLQSSSTAKWIFKKRESTQTEYHIDANIEFGQYVMIDRLFIEGKDIWIIDFKFPEAKTSNQSLYQQHHTQLSRYIKCIQQQHPNHNVHAGIYAPLTDQWVELSPQLL
jgi:ATP-dependent exoDNAse (exonuclease V) beta subunit